MWNESIPLLAATANLLLALLVLLNGPDRALHRAFAALMGMFFFWNFGTFRLAATSELFWHQFLTVGSALIPLGAFRFTSFYIHLDDSLRSRLTRILMAVSGALSVLAFTPAFTTTAFRVVHTTYMVAALCGISAAVFSRYRRTEVPLERHRLGYTVAALGIMVPAALLDAARDMGLPLARLGNLASLFTAAILALAIIRHRLLDLQVVLRGSLVFAVLIVMAVPLHGLLYATEHGGSYGTIATEVFVVVLATAIIFPWTTRWAHTRLTGAVMGPRSGRRQLLRTMRARSSAGELTEELLQEPLEEARKGLRAEWLALIRLDENCVESGRTLAGATHGTPRLEAREIRAMSGANGAIYRSEVVTSDQLPDKIPASCIEAMEAAGAELLIPIGVLGDPEGLLLAGPARGGTAYDALDVAFFEELAQEIRAVLQSARARRLLEARSRLAAIGEMSAGVAHEIRNPLAAMKGAVELLEEKSAASDPSAQQLLDLISKEVLRLERVVHDFLEYARPAEPDLAPERLEEVVRKTIAFLERDPGLEGIVIDQKNAVSLPVIPMDAEQMRQVIINLIRNAAQAMQGAGRVSIETARSGDEAILRVADGGPGFSEEALRRGFDPFYTTRSRGSGLGLAIVNRIVERHGGRTRLRNRHPRGAEVVVALPLDASNHRGPAS